MDIFTHILSYAASGGESNPPEIETITVTVTNPTTGDQELITLTETGVATGIFRNTSALPSSVTSGLAQQNGTLYALQGNGLVATFINTLFGGTFTANATITTLTQTKKLYLTDTLALDRVNPAAVPVDSTTANTAILGGAIQTIAQDARSTGSSASTNSLSVAHATGSGTNRLMLVMVTTGKAAGNLPTVSGITYGGQSLTLVNAISNATNVRSEMWMLVNPPSGASNAVISLSEANPVTATVITYTGVNQTTPLGTSVTAAPAKGNACSVVVTSASNELVVDSFAVDGDGNNNAPTPAAGSGQTILESMKPSIFLNGAVSSKAGAASTTMAWSWGGNKQQPAQVAVPIRPASTGGTTSATFTQTPAFATAFTMPSGATPSASIYFNVLTGSMPASPTITAVLKRGATVIATSSSVSASGGLLSFTFPALASAVNFAIGEAVTLDITSTQTGVTFTVDYDSSTKPSVINLPTTTVIVITSFGLYDAPFPGGSLISSITNGQRVYARATASDPFGAYDITSLDLTITDPSAGTSTVNLTSTVASTASTKTYEYSWLAGPSDGGYTVQAKANEGTEGINAISTVPLQVTSLDLGTPSTTTFTDSSGNTVPSYTTTGPVYVQVVDRDQNTNPAVAETVTVVVTTSNGDRETITLTETGADTGIFRSAAITTNTSAVTQANNALNVVAGATLAANYVDPTDPADTSSASAFIASPPGTPVASVFKSLISPTNAKALVGGTVSYNITITNPGTVALASVVLTDTFPAANLQFASASVTPNTTGSGTLSWTGLGPLAAGQSVSLTVNFTALLAGATVTNTASVTSNAPTVSSSVNVAIEQPGVTVTKTLLTPAVGPVYIGDTIVWRIVVANTGSTSLTTVPLSDNFSSGALTYVSATTAPDSVGAGSLLWNNIGPIAAAASRTIDVTMTVKGTSNPTTNTADVSYAVDASGNPVSPSVGSASVQTIGGSIGTTIFRDMNNNGVFDSGEGVQNVYVYSDTNGNGTREVGEPFGITDYYGAYSIDNLPVAVAGTTYAIKVDTTTLPAGLTTVVVDPDATKNGQTSITLTRAALDNTTANFGYRGTASVSDTVWLDVNGNGVLDVTDRRISGVKVFIDQNNNGTADANEPFAITDSNGNYLISDLPNGTWTVAIDTTTLPAAVSPTYDLNGIATAHKTSVVLTPGQARTDVDFGYIGSASIATSIFNDLNGDGVKALTEPGLAGVNVFIDLNGNGTLDANEQFATTDANGTYLISGLTAGTYAVVVDATTLPSGLDNTGDPDASKDGKTTVTLASAQSLTTANFGYRGNAIITGHLYIDTNGNGVQDGSEPDLANVDVLITDSLGSTQTVSTNASGDWTANVPPGSTTADIQESDAQYPTGYTQTQGADPSTFTAVSGVSTSGGTDGYYLSGAISGFVLLGADPLPGVTLTLLDSSGNPVDGDPNTNGVQQITSITQSDGSYTFANVPPGAYRVGQAQPFGYESVSDRDGGDINIIGDITPVVVTAGQTNAANNFIEKVDTCPDNWAEWKAQHPGEIASGNPDLDSHDNLTEFAFAMPAGSGAGDAWRIQPSVITPGKIDAVFTRPVGAPDNVVYTLQHASSIGNPTSWSSIALLPSMYVVVNNGDCTETITITDLEILTGLTGGTGVVRIKAELDETNDSSVDHTSYTEAEGWKRTPFGICCQTYNTPYLSDTVFTGVVDTGGISGQVVDLAGSSGTVNLATLLSAPGATYFLEITDGTGEGNRFDVVSATGSTVTLANDASLSAAGAPYNTVTGAPSGFEGSSVVIRRHRTLAEIFPPSGFVASTDQALADEIQIHSGGTWTILHLYDDSGTPRWVDNFNSLIDQGGIIIAPGQGLFFNNRNSAKNLLAYGEIRENDFIRPLASGSNLVGGGYPLDQSATGTGSRVMTLAKGFFGSKDFKTADSIFVWKGDTTPGTSTYDTYYLLNGAPQSPALLRWVRVGDATLLSRDAAILMLSNRSVFTRSATPLPTYGYPAPWTP